MQHCLREQSGAATSYAELAPVPTSLSDQSLFQTLSPTNEHPTVLQNLESDDFSGGQVPDVSKMAHQWTTPDLDADTEYLQGGSAPINITGRKRTYTSSSAHTPDPMETFETSPRLNSFMERNCSLMADELSSVTSPKQGRSSMNAASCYQSVWVPSENSSDAFSMDEQSPTLLNALPKQFTPPRAAENRRAEKHGKESMSSADREIINSCLPSGQQLLNDNRLTKMGDLSIEWVKPPAKKVRPSYNCEGSRGAIKTEDGSSVELNVNLASGGNENYVAVIIAACISDKKGQKVEGHPHFQTNCVSDQPSMETSVDGVAAICIKKTYSGEHNKLKMDVGLKRSTGRTSKLDRKCKVIYRLYLCKQAHASGRPDWSTAHWAQIVTDTISCEQSQGPPSITNLTSTTCPPSGGMVVAAKGKNLESKADGKPNVDIKFSHKSTSWSATAQVYHNVTTKESLAFKVPPFKAWKEMLRLEPSTTSVTVSIEISVDNKASESATEFKYVRENLQTRGTPHLSSASGLDGYTGLEFEDVVSVLHEVENHGSIGESSRASAHVGAVGAFESFGQQNLSLAQSHGMSESQRLAWKAEPSLSSSCMMYQGDEMLQWGLTDYDQSVNEDVEQLHIDDKSGVRSMWPGDN